MNNQGQKGYDLIRNCSIQHCTGLLLIFLLILRCSIAVARLLQMDIDPIIVSFFEGFTFLTIAILIVIHRQDIALFRIDRSSLGLIILGGSFLRPAIRGEPIVLSVLFFGVIGVWVIIHLMKNHINLQTINPSWLIIGLATGSALALLLYMPFYNTFSNPAHPYRLFLELIAGFSVHLSHSAILEEPIFRGFMWGYLQSKGWSNPKIWLFQAILFWVVHMNYISQPYVLLVEVPIAAMIFGILVWVSGSIAPAIMAHAVFNALVGAFFR